MSHSSRPRIVPSSSSPARRSEPAVIFSGTPAQNCPRAPANAILAPNFKFGDMGIGGLDSEFSTIFRRAFASRVFPPSIVEKLGIQHVKGKLPA